MLIKFGKLLRICGNLVIIFFFCCNLIAAWKDISSPFWIFNFIMLGATFYLLNVISCCWEEEAGDILESYPPPTYYGTLLPAAGPSPPYSSLKGETDSRRTSHVVRVKSKQTEFDDKTLFEREIGHIDPQSDSDSTPISDTETLSDRGTGYVSPQFYSNSASLSGSKTLLERETDQTYPQSDWIPTSASMPEFPVSSVVSHSMGHQSESQSTVFESASTLFESVQSSPPIGSFSSFTPM